MKNRVVLACDDELLFAKNLRLLRQTQKPYLSQKRIAQRLGVCRTTYISYEMGRRQPPAFFVANTARYFNISADRLLKEKLWKE